MRSVSVHHVNQNAVGIAIGGALGFAKSLAEVATDTAGHLQWESVTQTILLSAIGAAVGFIVTELLKYIKKKLL